MDKIRSKRNILLAEKIADIFSQGIHLSTETLQYLYSTAGINSLQDLFEIIQDETHCERESLLELIFFPDLHLQMSLEDILETYHFQAGDEKHILSHIQSLCNHVYVFYSNKHKGIPCLLQKDILEKFLKRLKIEKTINPQILAVLKNHCQEQEARKVKVLLRNSRIRFNEDNTWLIKSFLESYLPDAEHFWDKLQFIIAFVEGLREHSDFFEELQEKRFLLSHALDKAKQLNELMSKQNMETLIMQRVNILSINTEQIKKDIGIIDELSFRLFPDRRLEENFHPSSF